MELELSKTRINYKKPVIMKKAVKEETFELIIPDSQPDILNVISVNCVPLLRAKDTDDRRLTVSCTCETAILYEPEAGNGVCRLTTSPQFSAVFEDDELKRDSYIVSHISAVSCEGRVINSRKLIVKLELMYSVWAYNSDEIYIPTGTAGESSLQLLTISDELTLTKAVNEKTFAITDCVDISQNISDILSSSVSFEVAEVKSVGNKAVVKGDAVTKILVTDDGVIKELTFRSPFSQIVDLDEDKEAEKILTDVMQTSMYISKSFSESDSREQLSIEIRGVIQCCGFYKETVTYIYDAYDLNFDLQLEHSERKVKSVTGIHHMTSSARANTDTGKGVKSIISLKNFDSMPNVQETEFGVSVSVPVTVSALVNSGDMISSASKKTELEFKKSGERGSDYFVMNFSSDTSGNPFDSEVSFSVEASIDLMETREYTISFVDSITYDENNGKDLSNAPSLIVYRVPEKPSLWEICKKYNAVKSAIMEENNIKSESDITSGMKILIPKTQNN